MKVLAVLILCAFAAVQGRSAIGAQSSRDLAALGDAPYVVHLRIAVSTSGLLESGVGSLITPRWVLTSASAITDARFIWIRYGVMNVINPSLVTETSAVRTSGEIALASVNRDVHPTANIASIGLGTTVPEIAGFCGFGENDDGTPGESLSCGEVSVSESDGAGTATGDISFSKYDIGAPLVSDGVQFGVVSSAGDDDSAGGFILVSTYLDWIVEETGLDLSSKAAKEEDDSLLVKFVN